MSGPAISSSLLVAALDLNLVQLLRHAINTPDPMVAAQAAGAGSHVSANCASQAAHHAVNRSAGVRNADAPAATFHPSKVLHFQPRLNAMQPEIRERPVMPVDAKPFIQPPWKVLPWPVENKCAAHSCRSIKPTPVRVDISDVGRTLDLFI